MTNLDGVLDASAGVERVSLRRIYYLCGFDPRGARYYHQLCQEEAAKESSFGKRQIRVGSRTRKPALGAAWTLRATGTDGYELACEQVFMAWDDVVRAHWPRGNGRILARLLDFYVFYIGTGSMARLWQLQRRFAWTVLTPLVYSVMLITLVLGLVGLTGALLAARLPQLDTSLVISMAALPGFALGWTGLRLADQWKLFWLSRIWLFVRHWALGDDALEERWKAMAEAIHQDMVQHPADEHVLMAHSIGAMVAIPVLAHLAEQFERAGQRMPIALLTYGQVNPMLSLSKGPGVDRFQGQARAVAKWVGPWLDLSVPRDALSCALTSPLAGTGAPERSAQLWIKSARFDLRYDEAAYRALSKDAFGLHFEYLRASAERSVFQHFDLVCGPDRLAELVRMNWHTP